MTEYPDMSLATRFHTVQGLYPPVTTDERPMWFSVFFLGSRDEARASLEWGVDNPTYDHLLDMRVVAPSLPPRQSGGLPWAPLSAAEQRVQQAANASRRAEAERLMGLPSPEPAEPAEPRTEPLATRDRAASAFRKAVERG